MNSDKLRVAEIDESGLARGIESIGSFLTKEFTLDESSVNIHKSEFAGIGPRYGMQPVPYHDAYVTDPNTGVSTKALKPQSLRYSERVGFGFAESRTSIYAIYPIRMQQFNSQTLESTIVDQGITYFFVTDNLAGYVPRLLTFGYTGYLYFNDDSLWIARHGKNFNKGYVADNGINQLDVNIGTVNTMRVSTPNLHRVLPTNPNYIKTAFSTITGIDNSYNNILGLRNFQTLTTAPKDWFFSGFSKEINYKNFPQNSSYYEVIVTGTQGAGERELYKRFVYNSLGLSDGSDSSSYLIPDFALGYSNSNANITTAANTVVSGTNAGAINNNLNFLFKNTNFKINSTYSILFAAGPNPVGGIFQEWIHQRGSSTTEKPTSMQYFDPTENYVSPMNQVTFGYLIDDFTKSSCFSAFPPFISGASLAKDTVAVRDGSTLSHYTLGAANSGLLRANTVYELTYAVYDKGTNVESNVGSHVQFQTGSDDFVRISIYRQKTTGTKPEMCPISQGVLSPKLVANFVVPQNGGNVDTFSHYQLRFYYRAVGSFEWLPTSRIDYAQFYFDPTIKTFWICENAVAGLPGGQPGGFNDYSPLPKNNWFDVVFFQGFAFWMAPSSLVYSNKNSPFTYPLVNAVNISKGYCKGMIEHVYPGQSIQSSRLLVFTSEAIYAGRFTGNFQQSQVRVSPTESATFDLPGSDLELSFWTSNVAFSSRSAVVARGVLYYWGPTGIYRDVGNELPDKLFSMHLEPFVNKIYNNTKTDEIHSIYNDKTKEVIWFYTPNNETNKTKALCFNTVSEAFFIFDFGAMNIDAAQLIDIQMSRTNNSDICGQRIALYARSQFGDAQEVVFFDDLCNSGDLKPENIKVCSAVAIQGANRRLTFPTVGASLPTTGELTIFNYNAYSDIAPSTGSPDGIYNIVGGNTANYIDIEPINGTWVGNDFQIGAITDPGKQFPVAWAAEHGFNYKIVSDYYLPGGMQDWWRFIHCHQAYRVDNLLRSFSSQKVRLKFRTVLGTDSADRDVPLVNNSRGMCQAFSQMVFTKQNHESQAVSIELTGPNGLFCGSRWQLQYLAYHCQPQTQGALRTFEL